MPVRDIPPPPPDLPYRWNYADTSMRSRLLMWGAVLFVLAITIGGISALDHAERLLAEKAAKRTEFIGRCIEFHALERCATLYSYGRQDLMEKR